MSTHRIETHPLADVFPMLPDDDLARLSQDIAENGQRDPILMSRDGRLIDGRNRLRACEMAGIEPWFETYDGEDVGALVRSRNVTRRHLSTGQQAMCTALTMQMDGLRDAGRWKYGSIELGGSAQSESSWRRRLNEAGVVLDYKPDLAAVVASGDLALDAAFKQAEEIRTSAERDKILARERAKREREEARAEAERNAQHVTDLTMAGSKYVPLIASGDMTPAAAWAAHQEDTRKEREREHELDRGRKSTVTSITNSVYRLTHDPANYVNHFLPHEERFVAEQMRLTRERIDTAINFLTVVREAVQS